MPTSGARSGTPPSRRDRGAGDGRVGPTHLKCGHETHEEPIVIYPGGKRVYRCPHGCGLEERSRRTRTIEGGT